MLFLLTGILQSRNQPLRILQHHYIWPDWIVLLHVPAPSGSDEHDVRPWLSLSSRNNRKVWTTRHHDVLGRGLNNLYDCVCGNDRNLQAKSSNTVDCSRRCVSLQFHIRIRLDWSLLVVWARGTILATCPTRGCDHTNFHRSRRFDIATLEARLLRLVNGFSASSQCLQEE